MSSVMLLVYSSTTEQMPRKCISSQARHQYLMTLNTLLLTPYLSQSCPSLVGRSFTLLAIDERVQFYQYYVYTKVELYYIGR